MGASPAIGRLLILITALAGCAVEDSPLCFATAGVIRSPIGATECDRTGKGCDCVAICTMRTSQPSSLRDVEALLDAGPVTVQDVGGVCTTSGVCQCQVETDLGCAKYNLRRGVLERTGCLDGGS